MSGAQTTTAHGRGSSRMQRPTTRHVHIVASIAPIMVGSNCRIPRHIEYLKKQATRYAERIKVKMAKYLYKLATWYAVRGKN